MTLHWSPHLSKGPLSEHVLVGDVGPGHLEMLEAILKGPEQGAHGGHHIGLRGLLEVVGGGGASLGTRGR